MATQDKCCTIAPYFKVQSSKLGAFKEICEQFVEKTNKEPKCLYYGFSFDEVGLGFVTFIPPSLLSSLLRRAS